MRKLLAILIVSILASAAWAEVLLYDDCSTVSAGWALTDMTMTSDGDVLRAQNSASGYAIRSLDSAVNEFTMVFDMKITDPGEYFTSYIYSPGAWPSEGVVVDRDFTAKASWNGTVLEQITPDTWYTVGIYSNGAAGYMAYWIVEGKGADLWNISKLYEYGTSPWSDRTGIIIHTSGNALYGDVDVVLDDIQINSGLDFTQGPLLAGDANRDGVVSAGDYASVQANFGNTSYILGIPGDANGDGVVSAGDYASVQANFGNMASSLATTVPEPISVALLSIGGLVGLIRRRK